jgi:hypothetical protein
VYISKGKDADKQTANYLTNTKIKKIKTMKKLTSIAKIATATTIGIGALSISSAAHAAVFNSFNLGAEGEVALTNNGSTCLSNATCIQTQPFGFKVTSLDYDGLSPTSNKPSLLFSDNRDTANTYKKGGATISFFGEDGGTKLDEGTNTPLGQFWLRPVALGSNGKPLEKGRLETGLFNFDFLGETVSKLVLSLHDVEYKDSTKVIKVNGVTQTLASLIATVGENPNNAIQEITLRNVKNFEIQLGQVGQNPDKDGISFNTGDGVTLQGTAVPEPGVNASLGALGLAAMFGLNRRRNSKAVKFN